MFAKYLNEFIGSLNRESCRGIQVSQSKDVNVLLYADDMVLCDDTVGGWFIKTIECS